MERRFSTALVSALVLHAALLGLSVLSADGSRELFVAKSNEVEVSLVVADGPPAPTVTERPSDEASFTYSQDTAHARPATRGPSSLVGPAPAADTEPSPAEALLDLGADGAGAGTVDAPEQTPRPHIDLGLDGSIVARALRDTEQPDTVLRSTRRRPVFAFDGWSEGVVSKVAHSAAPSDGSALLTIEWDAQGRLASIRSSAESSNPTAWRKVADALRKQLAQRPQAASKGLRLTYLVKSEVVKPGKRSKLPESRNVQAQQLKDDYLPPASALMLGVNADTSPAGQRVVSVTLANSQVL